MRAFIRNSLNLIGFIGGAGAFNAVPLAFFDIITVKEAIAVIFLGGITTAIASLVNKFVDK